MFDLLCDEKYNQGFVCELMPWLVKINSIFFFEFVDYKRQKQKK